MTARSGDDTYYEICIALDSSDSGVAEQLSDIFVSAIMDFSGEAVEIQGAKIIIRTSKDRQFIDALLAHIGDLSANLSEIWQKRITTTNTIEIKQNRDWIAEYKKGIKPLRCGKFYIYPPWEKPRGNLFWGMQFAPFSHKTALDERSSSISLVSRKNGAKPHRHYFDCDSLHESNKNINKKPLKSFCYFWLLPKVESPLPLNSDLPIAQSAIKTHTIQGKQITNDSRIAKMDSSRCRAQNDESFVDCHDSANPESRNDKYNSNANSSIVSETQRVASETKQKSGLCSCERGNRTDSSLTKRTTNLPDLSPQDEFATINIVLEPSLAFGTGHHSSTFMCIEAIQALDSQYSLKNKKLLDFGCGSGILALCASKLGAVVDLCDIDESAIVESKKNFNNNNATISHIWQGGIADSVAKKGAKSGIYDIIVANIIASVLIEQKDNIDSSLKCGGIAVLSGILDIYKDEVLARFSDFMPLAIRQKDEWICAILQKNKTLHKN